MLRFLTYLFVAAIGRYSQSILSMICYAIVAFTIISWDEVFPLFAYTGLDAGGLDFSAAEIGYCWLITGVSLILFQVRSFSFLSTAILQS